MAFDGMASRASKEQKAQMFYELVAGDQRRRKQALINLMIWSILVGSKL
jgi:hypothetical protein